MKQRFSSLDIHVIAHELSKTLVSLRVSNIYDLSSRIFLFKFAKPDHRQQFVVDSGFRCHLTSFARTTAGAPSAFVARLRKFLKTRRVTKVAQVGTDRILEIQFSDGQYRLFLEFYAGGNIVLTDGELKILALLRNVNEGSEHENIRQGSDYNLSFRQNINGAPPLSTERVKEGLQKYVDRQVAAAQAQATGKKYKKKLGDDLRKALSGYINEYPPILLDHSLHVTGFDTSQSPEDVLKDEALLRQVVLAMEEASKIMATIMAADPIKGYIIGKTNNAGVSPPTQATDEESKEASQSGILYNDFHPFKPMQLSKDSSATILEFDGFNKTVDEFFSSIEGQKLESRLQEREAAAHRKLQNARQDQEKRIGGLQAVQGLNVRKAQAIEANLVRVEEATAAINSLIAQGMDWVEIERLIELEQKRHNPVADVIKLPLKLNENTATLLLGEWEEEVQDTEEAYDTDSEPSESDSENVDADKENGVQDKTSKAQGKGLMVDIDLALSGWSNAREYYDQKKTAAAKEEKTVQASAKALKSAQQKIEADLKRGLKQEKDILRPVRTQLWFEKFIYFISSDGYLVIGGKDAQQNDTIYRRYLKRGDAYVHADLNGAAPMVIKNNPATPDAPLPPSTLSQAGNLSVATSTAWDSKAVMSAWWAPAHQVTKVAPTGDYLGPGKVHIKGEKSFLPPAQLLLGFAVMFRISDESKARHTRHRVPGPAMDRGKDPTEVTSSQDQSQADQADAHGAEEDDDHSAPSDDGTASDAASEPDDEDDEGGRQDQEDGDEQESRSYVNPLQTNGVSMPQTNGSESLHHTSQAQAEHKAAGAAEEEQEGQEEDNEEADAGEEEEEDETQPTTASTQNLSGSPTAQQPPPSKPKQALPVRGKRGKRKKMATKYAEQDDEDRDEAMRLLGSTAGQDKAAAEAAARKARDEEAAAQRQRRKEQHERAQAEGRKREERKGLQEEERKAAGAGGGQNDDDDDDDTTAAAVDLDTLVGAPMPGDEILEAIPVCAPWSALGRYKYKAKLQPGSTKKGKAVREILGSWTAASANKRNVDEKGEDKERMWPREVELLKGWKDTEIFNVVPVSKVRVMMSASSGGGKGGGGTKGKGRGGKGSKKAR